MKRSILVVLTLLAAVTRIPSSARADAFCTVLRDPVGDAHGFTDAFGATGIDEARALDLRAVGVSFDGASLAVRMHVLDLNATAGTLADTAQYRIQWTASDGNFTWADATRRSGQGWSFGYQAPDGTTQPAGGSVDTSGNAVTLILPAAAAGGAGSEMKDFTVTASEGPTFPYSSGQMVGLRADNAPDSMTGFTLVLDGTCPAPLDGTASPCTVLRDAPSDETSAAGNPDPTQDILAVELGTSANALIVQSDVADLSSDLPAGVSQQSWQVSWIEGQGNASAQVTRDQYGISYSYTDPIDGITRVTDGSYDPVSRTMRVVAPFADGRRPDDELTQISAMSTTSRGLNGYEINDNAPDGSDPPGAYIIGSTCGAPVQPCPIVIDAFNDEDLPSVSPQPHRSAASDLREIGARTTSDALEVQLHVSDVRAPDQTGAAEIGWTVTWVAGETTYFAQGERLGTRELFTYGLSDGGAGPFFSGRTTPGSINADRSIIEISVPRALIDAPDGTDLVTMQALSWHTMGANSTAATLEDDSTDAGHFALGSTCAL